MPGETDKDRPRIKQYVFLTLLFYSFFVLRFLFRGSLPVFNGALSIVGIVSPLICSLLLSFISLRGDRAGRGPFTFLCVTAAALISSFYADLLFSSPVVRTAVGVGMLICSALVFLMDGHFIFFAILALLTIPIDRTYFVTSAPVIILCALAMGYGETPDTHPQKLPGRLIRFFDRGEGLLILLMMTIVALVLVLFRFFYRHNVRFSSDLLSVADYFKYLLLCLPLLLPGEIYSVSAVVSAGPGQRRTRHILWSVIPAAAACIYFLSLRLDNVSGLISPFAAAFLTAAAPGFVFAVDSYTDREPMGSAGQRIFAFLDRHFYLLVAVSLIYVSLMRSFLNGGEL